ncbi:MAG: hypothetical protein M3155_03970 [Actinomycetota bacterium]|nr:hypothetical protein [Actinomycetota bacterium]
MTSRATVSAALLATAALALAACGGGGGATKPTKLSITLSGSGKAVKYTVPASAKGGLVEITFHNQVAAPPGHSAQLIRVVGGHTVQEVFQVLGAGPGHKIPAWIHAEGGAGPTAPNSTSIVVRDLPAGSYFVVDVGGQPQGPPANAAFKVTKGKSGKLPHASSVVNAAKLREHHFAWKLSGRPLKAGVNRIEFKSGGKDALHHIAVFKVTGKPSNAALIKALNSNGPPPKFVDQRSFYNTSTLEGGKAEVTQLPLSAGPGNYVLFCPLTDREGGKPHYQEGLLKTVTIK